MKPLSVERMIEICAATPEQVHDATDYFGNKLGDGQWIKDGLAAGHYLAEVCAVAGAESYLAVFHVTQQNTLVVNAFVKLSGGAPANLVACAKALAAKHGCGGISCQTNRPGMVKTLMAGGFQPAGIKLELTL